MLLLKLRKLLMTYRWGIIRLSIDKVYTLMFYNQCRLIRRPFYIRGGVNISLGYGFTTGVGNRLDTFDNGQISIGINCQVNDYNHIASLSSITIGDDCLIASRVTIIDHDHGDLHNTEHNALPPANRPLVCAPIEIGNCVWIGENVTILAGSVVGQSSVIAAGSVVKGHYPANSLIAGVPAKQKRSLR
jgi:lipopolysaccharide O-acetyltransferase